MERPNQNPEKPNLLKLLEEKYPGENVSFAAVREFKTEEQIREYFSEVVQAMKDDDNRPEPEDPTEDDLNAGSGFMRTGGTPEEDALEHIMYAVGHYQADPEIVAMWKRAIPELGPYWKRRQQQ